MTKFTPSTADAARARNVQRLAMIMIVAMIIISAFAFYASWPISSWLTLGADSAPLVMVLAAVVSLWLSRRGRVQAAALLLASGFLAAMVLQVLLTIGFGLLLGLSAFAVTTAMAIMTLPHKQSGRLILISVFVSILIVLLDQFGPADRAAGPGALQTFIPIAGGLTILIYGIVAARQFRSYSLSTKLILVLMITTTLSIGLVSFLSAARTQQITDFLSDQLHNTVRTQAEQELGTLARRSAESADQFFSSATHDVTAAADYLSDLFAQQSTLGQGAYWNARQKVARTPTGQWDNPNTDPGSVYAPSTVALTDLNTAELNTTIYLDFVMPNILRSNPNMVAIYFVHPSGMTLYYPNIDLAAVVGEYNPSQQPYFTLVSPEVDPMHNPAWTPPYLDRALNGLVATASAPVYDRTGKFRGVVAADVQLARVTSQVSQIKVAQSGFAFLINASGQVIAMPDAGYKEFGLTPVSQSEQTPQTSVVDKGSSDLQAAVTHMRRGETGLTIFTADSGDRYIAYAPLPDTDYSLGVIVPVDEMIAPFLTANQRIAAEARTTQSATVLIFGVVLATTLVVSLGISRVLTTPLRRLTETAQRIGAGDLNVEAEATTPDEFGTLAHTFNVMADQLRQSFELLERRVQARTDQLRASADVGRAAASTLDTDALLRTIVNLIADRFGFYYTAVFTLDDTGKLAVLREATGEAGRILKQRSHQLPIGGQSMVGTVLSTRQARIALDVGTEAVRFANPLLPETRSEIALPLIVGDHVLGALDVQSMQEAAFDESDAAVLQAMADQIAIALSNAEQFKATQTALTRAGDLYRASQAVAEARDTQDVLQSVITHLAPEAKRAAIILFGPTQTDGQYAYLTFAAAWVRPGFESTMRPVPPNMRYTVEQFPIIKHIAPGKSIAIPDVNTISVEPGVRALMRQFGAEAMVGLPLVVGRNFLGFIAIGYHTPRQFSSEHLQSLMALSSQAAIAIQNQQSLAETQTALKQLDEINRRLTRQTWREFARPTGGLLRLTDAEPGAPMDASTSGDQGLRAPIVLRGEAIGSLSLQDVDANRAWTPNEIALLNAVANEVSVAIENARLLEQTEQRAQREQLVSEIGRKMLAANDMRGVLQAATDELGRVLRLSRAEVRIGTESAEPAAPAAPNGHADGPEVDA
jgi:GAF domain-containing protein/HAMP domain-containing protein